ncbi:hypothetical protein B0A49_00007 [Cryomyces minteri]|uniref:HPP transmembrane region domain-containing protein n=1 Tax=Cryomyces minteri TaxID=331657 RepID=A0A4V5NKW6_9PEZI|nr:hypothetical protein B0A49_00007 [Cryomyces minteri]
MHLPKGSSLNFDIDNYLNRIVPASRLNRLPKPISHFLGYRVKPPTEPGHVLIWFWSFFGAFVGILTIAGSFKASRLIQSHHPPVIFASLGASAVLSYNQIHSPLAQPRSSIVGHTLCAIVGVSVSKLFQLNSGFEDIQWIAAAMACSCALLVMMVTNTVYPPGGASALLATIDVATRRMGWHFVSFILLGSILMLLVALITNNIQRRFPVFWWTPRDLTRPHPGPSASINGTPDVDVEKASRASEQTLVKQMSHASPAGQHVVIVSADRIVIPSDMELSNEERRVLESLRTRLATGMDLEEEMEQDQQANQEAEVQDGRLIEQVESMVSSVDSQRTMRD